MIAPLAPFIDPGSGIFEEPEKYGYHFFYKTLKEHRRAMLMPSWKFTLNYETKWMSRDEIVKATYDAALQLVDFKERYGVIGKQSALKIRDHLERAVKLNEKITDPAKVDDDLRDEIFSLNTLDSVCGKHELDWPISGWKLKVPNLIKLLLRPSKQRPCGAFSPMFNHRQADKALRWK